MKRIFLLLGLLVLAACTTNTTTSALRVSLVADGRERTFAYSNPVTVEEFLRDPLVNLQLGELDRVNPSLFTQLADGMRVTVVRVSEKTDCQRSEIPYKQTSVPNEALKPGEQQVSQVGRNGIQETCYRVTYADGTESTRTETSTTEILVPQDEIISVGPSGEIEPVAINGAIAYINNRNAWVIRGSSTAKRLLTTTSDLDNQLNVFSLSPDGRQLLFARTTSEAGSLNQLWLIADINQNTVPVTLVPSDVIYADWLPAQDNTITYSTAQVRDVAPQIQANNDLWTMRIDPATGDSLSLKSIVEHPNGGLYGWWGTRFQWSPDGTRLAWVQATQIGLVDLEAGTLKDALLTYPVFRSVVDWSWRATLSWSPDNALIVTTVHGAPVGRESAENSPAFDVTIVQPDGQYAANAVKAAGIWAAPQFSPFLTNQNSEFPQGYLAYLQARDPFNSINGEYDLVIADRDGSNARVIFPAAGQPGLTAQQSIYQNREFAWSPDGRQIAIIYQGNLWVVEADSGVAHQLTLDGGASHPVWTK